MKRTPRAIAVSLFLLFFPAVAYPTTLTVTSFPEGAQVWIDNTRKGEVTPMSVEGLAVGSTVRLRVLIPESGLAPYESKVSLNAECNEICIILLPPAEAGAAGIQSSPGRKGL